MVDGTSEDTRSRCRVDREVRMVDGTCRTQGAGAAWTGRSGWWMGRVRTQGAGCRVDREVRMVDGTCRTQGAGCRVDREVRMVDGTSEDTRGRVPCGPGGEDGGWDE